MKIFVVHNEYQEPGGEDTVFQQEVSLLSRFGHEVLTYQRSNLEIGHPSGLQQLSLLRQLVWAKDTRQDIFGILRREKPAIVHVHNTFTQISPSVYAACAEAGVPVVQTLHNFRLLCPAATFSRNGRVCEDCATHSLWHGVSHGCYRNSRMSTAAVAAMLTVHRRLHTWTERIHHYIALTEFARQKFVSGGLPAEKISVKPNFVYPDPGQASGKGEYAIFVGRLSGEKGLRTLLDAWSRLNNSVPLQIIGDGIMRTELEEQAARSNLSSVYFCGRMKRDEAQKAIRSARFVVLPSECYENFPMAVAEGFACGLPVICSRLGAMQEIVEDQRTGLHFIPNNSEDLAEKVAWAWAHPEQIRIMGKEAREEYQNKYTAERNYSMLMDIYHRTLEKSQWPQESTVPVDYAILNER